MTSKEELILNKYFGIYESENDFELETWTNGGVNMFIYLNKNEDITQQFREYVENFDIDEEIEIHRQGKDYKDTFTITESVEDFTYYKNRLNAVLKELESNDSDIKVLCDSYCLSELKELYVNDFDTNKHTYDLLHLIDDYKLRQFLVDLFVREYSFKELRNKLYKIKWGCDYE